MDRNDIHISYPVFSLFLKSFFKGIFKPFERVKIKGKLRVIFSIKMSGKCLKISYGEFTVISTNTPKQTVKKFHKKREKFHKKCEI